MEGIQYRKLVIQMTEELRNQIGWRGNPEITRSQGHPWKREPGKVSLISFTQKMQSSEREGRDTPISSFFLHTSVSCQCLPLTKLSQEPDVMEPGKCSLQGLVPCKTGQGRRSWGRGNLKAYCLRTTMKGVKLDQISNNFQVRSIKNKSTYVDNFQENLSFTHIQLVQGKHKFYFNSQLSIAVFPKLS